MSKHLTPKQEAFVQAYHRLGNQRAAYKEAYDAENMTDKTIDERASRLVKECKISARLVELQERVAKKTEITVETITKMLAKAYKLAVDEKQTGAAVAASMGLGKLHGLIIDRSKTEVIRKRDVADFGDDELAAIAKSGSAGTPTSPDGAKGSDKLH